MRQPVPRSLPWWPALLLLALAFAQWQGLVHGVLHPGHVSTTAAAVADADGDAHDHHEHPHEHHHDHDHDADSPLGAATVAAWFGHLIPAHDDGGGCRLFDQASHADLLLQAPFLARLLLAPVAVPASYLPLPRGLRPICARARDPPTTA